MRFFEILSCLLTIPPIALMFFAPGSKRLFVMCCLLPVLTLAIHALYEGPHWQMGPAYCAGLVFLACGVFAVVAGLRLPRVGSVLIALACLLLVGGTVALSWVLPMFRLPKPSGQYAVGTRIVHLVDSSRTEEGGPSPSGKRELMVQFWYPAQKPSFFDGRLATYQRRKEVTLRASYRSVLRMHAYEDAAVEPGGPYPVLLYNPGWNGERTESTFQMEELASLGFIVVAIDHTFYGGLVEFPDGRVADSHAAPAIGSFENSSKEEQWALGNKYVRIEAEDDVFVLDQIEAMNRDPASPWFGALDLTRVGAMGFSIGGAVAAQTAYQDPRVKAALNLDGWTFGDAGEHGLAKPFMVVYEDKEQTVPTAAQLTSGGLAERLYWETCAEDYRNLTTGMTRNGGYLLFINGTNHVDFTDRSLFSPLLSLSGRGSLGTKRAHAVINAYTVAFFSHFLNGKNEPLLETSPSPFSEVEFHAFHGTEPVAAKILGRP
jgi:predicted dienelactone hydrolase